MPAKENQFTILTCSRGYFCKIFILFITVSLPWCLKVIPFNISWLRLPHFHPFTIPMTTIKTDSRLNWISPFCWLSVGFWLARLSSLRVDNISSPFNIDREDFAVNWFSFSLSNLFYSRSSSRFLYFSAETLFMSRAMRLKHLSFCRCDKKDKLRCKDLPFFSSSSSSSSAWLLQTATSKSIFTNPFVIERKQDSTSKCRVRKWLVVKLFMLLCKILLTLYVPEKLGMWYFKLNSGVLFENDSYVIIQCMIQFFTYSSFFQVIFLFFTSTWTWIIVDKASKDFCLHISFLPFQSYHSLVSLMSHHVI